MLVSVIMQRLCVLQIKDTKKYELLVLLFLVNIKYYYIIIVFSNYFLITYVSREVSTVSTEAISVHSSINQHLEI